MYNITRKFQSAFPRKNFKNRRSPHEPSTVRTRLVHQTERVRELHEPASRRPFVGYDIPGKRYRRSPQQR